MKLKKIPLLITALSLLTSSWAYALTPAEVIPQLTVPKGFRVTIFAQYLPNIRSLALGDNGVIYAGTKTDRVYAFKDSNNDGFAETKYTLATGLNLPNGVAYRNGKLYVATTDKLLRYDNISNLLSNPPAPVVQTRFPKETQHSRKYLRFGADGKLYTTVGAPCNICVPDANHGNIVRFNPDVATSPLEIIVRGIRSSLGLDFQPGTNSLYFTDNGRDNIGDAIPYEELNRWSGAIGQHFGFPYCHGGNVLDPSLGAGKSCSSYAKPSKVFLSHNAPLGIRFYKGSKFPAEYRNSMLIAFHGSWNKAVKEGYRVATVKFANGSLTSEAPFVTGWLTASKQVLGRPVDILELPDGSVLISDDLLGAVYRVRYVG